MSRRCGRAHQLVCLLLALAVGARARRQVPRQPAVDPPKPEVLSGECSGDGKKLPGSAPPPPPLEAPAACLPTKHRRFFTRPCAVDLLEGLFSITAAEGNGSSSGSTPALAVPDGGWLACGRSTPCEDPKACCAIWVSATNNGEMPWEP